MEAYEGHEWDDSSVFNRKHQKFFEDVLLPRIRDELDNHRQLLIDSLREHRLNMPPIPQEGQGRIAAAHFALLSHQPDREASLRSKEATAKEDPTPEITPGGVTGRNWLDCSTPFTRKYESKRVDKSEYNRLQKAIRSKPFRVVTSLLIVANSIFIGIQEQFVAARDSIDFDHEHTGSIVEGTFATIFLVELLLRACADGWYFFTSGDRFWNLFDVMLVAQALFSVISEGIGVWLLAPNYSSLRVLRILRFFRVLRVLRMLRVMRHLRSVRIMLVSLASSLQSLLWVLLMLLFVIYIFSIIILQCLLEEPGQLEQQLPNDFGDLPQTLISLFMAITGGMDWVDLYTPLADLHGRYGLIFLCYIYFSVFGVLNVVTSMFADAVNSASSRDFRFAIHCEIDRHKEYVEACRSFFFNADKDGSGKLSWKEMKRYLRAEERKAHLATLELDESQAHELYNLMDVNREDSVDIEEFVQWCVRLKGPAKAIELTKLANQNAKFISEWKDFMDLAQEKLEAIVRKVGAMPTRTLDITVPDAVPDRMSTSSVPHLSV